MEYIVNVPVLRLGEKKVYVKGDRLDLSSELAAKLMKKAYIAFDRGSQKIIVPAKTKVEKLVPEGNVDKVKTCIAEIDDIDLLQKMAAEEESDKNRKTVLEAINERAHQLSELDEDDKEPENDEDPSLNFNPEDVIDNG